MNESEETLAPHLDNPSGSGSPRQAPPGQAQQARHQTQHKTLDSKAIDSPEIVSEAIFSPLWCGPLACPRRLEARETEVAGATERGRPLPHTARASRPAQS